MRAGPAAELEGVVLRGVDGLVGRELAAADEGPVAAAEVRHLELVTLQRDPAVMAADLVVLEDAVALGVPSEDELLLREGYA